MLKIQTFYINSRAVDCYLLRVPEEMPKSGSEYDLFGFDAAHLLAAFNFAPIDQTLPHYIQTEQLLHQCFAYFRDGLNYSLNPDSMERVVLSNVGGIRQLQELSASTTAESLEVFLPVKDYVEAYCRGIKILYSKEVGTLVKEDGTREMLKPRFSLRELHRKVSILMLNSAALQPDTKKIGFFWGIPKWEGSRKEYLSEEQLALACTKITRQKFTRTAVRDRLIQLGLLQPEVRKLRTCYEATEMGRGYCVEMPARKWHSCVLRMLIDI